MHFLQQNLARAHRVFATACIFDAIFVFLLWALVSQGFHGSFTGNSYMSSSVIDYNFRDSMFDIVCFASARMFMLLIMYLWLRKKSNIWVIMTTSLSTVALLVKVFFYNFTSTRGGDGIVFIAAFLIPWAEAWYFASRLTPINREIEILCRRRDWMTPHEPLESATQPASINMAPSISEPRRAILRTPTAVETTLPIPQADDEDDDGNSSPYMTPPSSPDRTPSSSRSTSKSVERATIHAQIVIYQQQGIEALASLRKLAFNIKWQFEFESSSVYVYSFETPTGRIYKSEGLVCTTAAALNQFLVEDFESQSLWNPLLTFSEVVEYVDDSTDVLYAVTKDSAGGLISPRDYVVVRRREKSGNLFLISTVQSEHHSRPVTADHVRSDYRLKMLDDDSCCNESKGLSGYIITPSTEQPNVCNLVWINNTHASGWVPGFIEDQARRKAAISFHDSVRRCISDRAKSGSSPQTVRKSAYFA